MENMNEMDNIIILTDDEGKDIEFELLDVIELEEVKYVVVLPTEETEDDEVVILRMNEDESFVGVEDSDVLAEVFEIFKERNGELFDFVD